MNKTKSVRLGVMPPLTGLVSLYGQEISRAAQIACAEINEQGGVLGHELELVIEDDGSMPDTAVKAAEKLVDEHKCVAIIGNLLSNSRIDVANRVADTRHIPYLNFSFYEGSINSRYFFHFAALPNQQIEKMIPWMADKYGPKMYFAGNNYEWPRGSIDAAKRVLTSRGGEIVGEEYFDIGVDDFSELMERLKKSGADVFVPYAAGSDQINLLNMFYDSGLKQRMAVVMGHYDEAMVANLRPEVREGLYSSNTYFMNIQNEENKNYLERLKRLPDVTGIWPAGNGVLTNFGEGTYLCVHAFAKAAEMAGTFDSEALVDALENVNIRAPQGVVSMDKATHHAKVNTWLSRCSRDGDFEIVQAFGQIAPVIPERYQDYNRGHTSEQFHDDINDSISQNNDHFEQDWQLVTVMPYPLVNQSLSNSPVNSPKTYDANVEFANELLEQIAANQELLGEMANNKAPRNITLDSTGETQHVRLTPLYTEDVCTHFGIHLLANKPVFKSTDLTIPVRHVIHTDTNKTAVIITDVDGVVTYVNEVALTFWALESVNDILGKYVGEFVDLSGSYETLFIDKMAMVNNPYTAHDANGHDFQLTISVDPIMGKQKGQVGCILSCHLPEDNDLKNINIVTGLDDEIIKAIDIGIITVDEDFHIIRTNSVADRMFGYSRDDMNNMPLSELLPPHLRENHASYINEFLEGDEFIKPMSSRANLTGYKQDGTFFPIEISISKFRSGDHWVMVATIRDISELQKQAEELIRNATHDPLTNLPNRMLMNDRITSALRRSERSGKSVALMFVDLDEFKLVNDTYGHDTGDQLLVAISNELVRVVRPGDTVARFGGDEFVVMCDQLTDWNIVTQLAERIVDRLKHPLTISGNEFYATVSIGVAIGHGLTHNADELLRNADAAMYKAKDRGRDGWMIFNDEMGENSRLQLKIATGLRNAVKNNELYTVLQPVIYTGSNEIIGAELLLRWNKDGEEISPAHFIPVAEMTGSILPIGEWVFQQACQIQRSWMVRLGNSAPYLSVNLSARQLNEPRIVERFSSILQETGADPEKIVLEITESTLMKDVEHTIRLLNDLGNLGLSLAVDDFGTGYSSLSQLQRLPVDTLKVDRIFVQDIDQKPETRLITTAIINMAHSLNLDVTAEGVETKAELDTLCSLGCDTIQGYYFYKPMPIVEFNRLLFQQGLGDMAAVKSKPAMLKK